MSGQSGSPSKADAVYGDGELPGAADLVALGASGPSAASTSLAAPEHPHSESITTEEQ
jgi:hypothetical protein